MKKLLASALIAATMSTPAIACMKIASLSLDPPILRHNRQTPSGLNGFLQAKSSDLGLLGHSDHVTV